MKLGATTSLGASMTGLGDGVGGKLRDRRRLGGFTGFGAQLVVNAHHLVERKRRWTRGGAQRGIRLVVPEVGNGGLEVRGQLDHPPLQVLLERGESSFGSFEAAQGEARGRGACFAERGGLVSQLLGRLILRGAQRGPVAFDGLLEFANAMNGILFETMLDRTPFRQSPFELADGLLMAFVRRRPTIENVRAAFGELGEPVLEGQQVILPFAPFTDGESQLVDLRLNVRSGVFHPAS